jgi:hypothetical protein
MMSLVVVPRTPSCTVSLYLFSFPLGAFFVPRRCTRRSRDRRHLATSAWCRLRLLVLMLVLMKTDSRLGPYVPAHQPALDRIVQLSRPGRGRRERRKCIEFLWCSVGHVHVRVRVPVLDVVVDRHCPRVPHTAPTLSLGLMSRSVRPTPSFRSQPRPRPLLVLIRSIVGQVGRVGLMTLLNGRTSWLRDGRFRFVLVLALLVRRVVGRK